MIVVVLLLAVVAAYKTTPATSESEKYTDSRNKREIQDRLVPPVIYNQTLGPVYIKDSKQYTRIYCQASKGSTVSWEYQGLNISDLAVQDYVRRSEGVQFQIEDEGSTLVIYDNQKRAISGYVQCFVSNEMGATFGDKVFVSHTVLGFIEGGARRTDIVAMEGDHVTLSCERHIETEPRADVLWFFGSQIIHPLTRRNFFCNDHMTMCVISSLTQTDSGVYKCNYNIPGMSKEIYKVFIVRVIQSDLNPAVIHPLNLMDHISSPSVVEAEHGAPVQLQCAFRGDAGNHVMWTHAKTDVSSCHADVLSVIGSSDDIKLERNGTMLYIPSLRADLEGYYLCTADNGYDRYIHRIQVRLIAPPVLFDKVYGEETYLGSNVRFNCSVSEAIPPASTTWWVNMNRVPESGLGRFHTENSGRILVLEGATVEDTSSITCNVSNTIGSVLGHRYVTVRNITLVTEEPEDQTEVDGMGNGLSQSANQMTEDKQLLPSLAITSHMTADVNQAQSATTSDHPTALITGQRPAVITEQRPAVTSEQTTAVLLTVQSSGNSQRTPDGTTEKYDVLETLQMKKTNKSDTNISLYYGIEAELDKLKGPRFDARRDPEGFLSSGSTPVMMSVTLGLLGLIVGFVLGFLVTWCVMRTRNKQKRAQSAEVQQVESLPSVRRSPIHKLHLDGKTSKSETMSMIHEGSVLETIT